MLKSFHHLHGRVLLEVHAGTFTVVLLLPLSYIALGWFEWNNFHIAKYTLFNFISSLWLTKLVGQRHFLVNWLAVYTQQCETKPQVQLRMLGHLQTSNELLSTL